MVAFGKQEGVAVTTAGRRSAGGQPLRQLLLFSTPVHLSYYDGTLKASKEFVTGAIGGGWKL